MTKLISLILDFTAIILAIIGGFWGIDNLLLCPHALFWFNSVIIVIFFLVPQKVCLKNYKPRTKVWSIYDFISDNVFVTICFVLIGLF